MTQAGTARYVRGLLSGIRTLAPEDLALQELAWPVENFDYRQPARAMKTAYREIVWCRTRARREMHAAGCDLLHSTSHLAFRLPRGTRRIHTLCDLAVLRYPERFRPWHRQATLRHLRHVADMDCILCISQFTAEEAMALLSIPAHKLKVIYCGSDLADRPGKRVAPESIPLPDEFFLFVGSLEPGKNLSLLRNVYRLAEEQGVALPPLLIVGSRWQGVEDEGTAPENWTYMGRMPDDTLIALYRHATALLFPSKYEGFGLPVLEAMSLGCHVICSRAASLPEVGGNAVCYSELDPRSFLNAMNAVRNEDSLRSDLRQRGRDRAKSFSWRRCATETVAAYEEVLK